MNKSGPSKNSVFETAVVKTLKKHLSAYLASKFPDVIRAQTKETCVWIKDGGIVLTFASCA